MKKILIGTALAGMIVGTFASLSFAAPLPAQLGNGGASHVIAVDMRCGPHHHFTRSFRDRHGRWIPGHCIHNDRGRNYR